MSEDIWVTKKDDVRYRIKDHTGEDFSYSVLRVCPWYEWQKIKCLSDLAERIGEDHYHDEPCSIETYVCDVDLLYNGKIYPFKITGQISIDWQSKQGEAVNYIMTEEDA